MMSSHVLERGRRTSVLLRQLALLAVVVVTLATSVPARPISVAAAPAVPTDLLEARRGHSATLLQTGEVLIAGGTNASGTVLKSAELYNPDTGEVRAIGDLGVARVGHTATLLPTGWVLIVGGADTPDTELYNPMTAQWFPAKRHPLSTTPSPHDLRQPDARSGHSATLLADGRVLVVGGRSPGGVLLTTVETYDPVLGEWSQAAELPAARADHAAVGLTDGRVLIRGGIGQDGTPRADSLIYDLASGWTSAGSLGVARAQASAVVLHNGRVLVTGGIGLNGERLSSVEIFTPGSGWSVGLAMSVPRAGHTASVLPSGDVAVVGGTLELTPSAERYSRNSGTWSPLESSGLPSGTSHTATMLPAGDLLVVGGELAGGGNGGLVRVQVRAPGTWQPSGLMDETRAYHTATPLADGQVLVLGAAMKRWVRSPQWNSSICSPKPGE
jgi:large repetitive protein